MSPEGVSWKEIIESKENGVEEGDDSSEEDKDEEVLASDTFLELGGEG